MIFKISFGYVIAYCTSLFASYMISSPLRLILDAAYFMHH